MLGKIAYLHKILLASTIFFTLDQGSPTLRPRSPCRPATVLHVPATERLKLYVNTLFYLTVIIILHINRNNVRKVISNA